MESSNREDRGRRNSGRSFFWPLLLIAAGVVALLANLGIIEAVNLLALIRLWPLLLIAAGIQVVLGRQYPWVGNLLVILLLAAMVAAVVWAPDLGLAASRELVTETFSEPLDGAASADVQLDIDYGQVEVGALEGGGLIEVSVTHDGRVEYSATGEERKTIRLHLDDRRGLVFDPFGWIEAAGVETEISLSPEVPISLDIDHGSGSGTYDLSALQLTHLDVNNGSGTLAISMPAGSYQADLGSGSGTMTVEAVPDAALDLDIGIGSGRLVVSLAEGASGDVNIDVGSGVVVIEVPEGVGVRVSGSVGSGSVSLPSGYVQISGQTSRPGNGIWESPEFDSAERQLFIEYSLGSGTLSLR